ncbi:MAG TPA: TIGR02679 family protein [Clostridia bacterium]|nr:TIGR02679 family protein [Clostridia bacterium]
MKNKEELAYFKKNLGYKRIFRGIYGRYRSLGRLGGRVTLRNLTNEERDILSSHLKRDYSRKQSASFSVKLFEESLMHTRFAQYSLEEILEWYFGVDLISKAEEEVRYLAQRDRVFQDLFIAHTGEPGESWLDSIIKGQGVGIRRIMVAYSQDSKLLMQNIRWVCHALKILDGRVEESPFRLPVLASLVTRDPHAFDVGTLTGDLLIDALCTLYGVSTPSNSQETAEILYKGGILVDEISNFVTISGLLAYKEGKRHPVWEAAMNEKEVLQVPLANLVDINRIMSPVGKVYIVENPAVFSAILDGFIGPNIPPMICSYGQVKLAGLVVLDKLVESGMELYYSGDFDPEGLLIAHKLGSRYGRNFHLWRYGVEEYGRVISHQKLSSKRLSILDSVSCPSFQEVKDEMRRRERAGYQELLIDKLLKDIVGVMG